MRAFVEAGLGNALVALVLAVVALLAGLVCRRPAVAHALWLLVLLKLVTPPLVSVSVPWPEEAADVQEAPRLDVTVEELRFEDADEPLVEIREAAPFEEDAAPIEEIPTPELPGAAPSWQTVFGLTWLAGSLTWLGVAVRRLHRFARLLRHARPASADLTERVAAVARGLGLRNPPRILLVQGHLSPMVWALGRVTLLVPAKLVATMRAAPLDTLLAHELAHIRRRDHWVRWLELAGLALYWWNPVVWLARRELRQAEELCCDAWVVRCLPDARRVYATAVVDALDFLSRPDEPVPALGCGLGRVDDLKWRLTMILRGQTSPRLGWTTALGVFALAALLLPLVPGFGTAQTPVKPEVPSARDLDPESRAKLKAEVDALIEKRVAEAKARTAEQTATRQIYRGNLIQAEMKLAHAKEIEALKAEIAARTAVLRQLEAARSTQKGVDPHRITVVMSDDVRALQLELADQTDKMKALTMRLEKTPKQSDDFRKLHQELDAHQEAVKGIQRKLNAARDRFIQGGQVVTIRIEIHGVKVDLADMNRVTGIIKKIDWKDLQDNKKDVKLLFSRPADPAWNKTPGASNGVLRITKPSSHLVPPPLAPEKGPSADRRIDAVEKKLDAVLKELEALRKAKAAPSRGSRRPGADPLAPDFPPPAPGAAVPGGAGAPLPPTATPGVAPPPLPPSAAPSGVPAPTTPAAPTAPPSAAGAAPRPR